MLWLRSKTGTKIIYALLAGISSKLDTKIGIKPRVLWKVFDPSLGMIVKGVI